MNDPDIEAAQGKICEDIVHTEHRIAEELTLRAASEALKKTQELHKPTMWFVENYPYCEECNRRWPCDTAKLVYTTSSQVYYEMEALRSSRGEG